MREFRLGDRQIGGGAPCFIVMEAGPTHTGLEGALELVDVVAASGADAIKFQILDTDRLMADHAVEISYQVLADKASGRTEMVSEPLYAVLKRRELSHDAWRQVKRRCDERGLMFMATVDFPETAGFLREIGAHALKIASGDVNNLPLISQTAAVGLPIMLDTGSSTIGEVERAVDACRAAGNEQIVIHHCPSGYPAHWTGINLRVIPTLKQMFDYPIAFSDHTPGWDVDVAALALGADMLEKTVTLDRATRSIEHIMSLEPQDLQAFVTTIRNLELALGTPRRILTEAEHAGKVKARRSLFLRRDMAAGEVITADAVDFRRPGTGIAPDQWPLVAGRRTAKDLAKGHLLAWDDLGLGQGQ